MFRFDCTFSNFNCTKRVQLHTILRPVTSSSSSTTKRRTGVCYPSCSTTSFIPRSADGFSSRACRVMLVAVLDSIPISCGLAELTDPCSQLEVA